MRSIIRAVAGAALALTAAIAAPTAALAADTQPMYRLYNPNGGEHFYTASAGERANLVNLGWQSEGVGWTAPTTSNTPVYRLYNPNGSDHHYTKSAGERDLLIIAGWKSEGIGWYSDDDKGVPLYRQYNPNAKSGSHNYTTSLGENNALVAAGWFAEGIGWYGVANGETPQNLDVKSQIELIAEKSSSWLFTHWPNALSSYCVVDLDHDGRLEILATQTMGSMRVSESRILEVNADATDLEFRYNTDDHLDCLLPDWTFHWNSDASSIINVDTYVSGSRRAYLVRDYLRVGQAGYTDYTAEVLVDGNSIQINKVRSYTRETILGVTSEHWNDGNDLEISADEYEQVIANRYAGWEKKNTAFNWLKEDDVEGDLVVALTKSWEGFMLS